MILSLMDIKINGIYNYYQSGAPTVAEKAPDYLNGETWLDIVTGYSYQLTDQVAGTWEQIELDLDNRIVRVADDTTKMVMRTLSNYFVQDRNGNYTDIQTGDYFPGLFNRAKQYLLMMYETVYSNWTFDTATKTITVDTDDQYGILTNFAIGDTILVKGSLRNDNFYTITNITSTVITVSETLVDGTSNAFISLCIIPQGFKNIVGQMIYYDLNERANIGPYQSERIGTYSYTLADFNKILGYPDSVISGLEAYNNIAIGGLDVFIN